MIDITIEQLKSHINALATSILCAGDMYRVDTGKGNLVIMEEAEYKILHEALELCIQVGTN